MECVFAESCDCDICHRTVTRSQTYFDPKSENKNCLLLLLSSMPPNFPIDIIATSFKQIEENKKIVYTMYFNSTKNHKMFLNTNKNPKLQLNFFKNHNIRLYFEENSKIICKHQINTYLIKQNLKLLYAQAYYPQVAILVSYDRNKINQKLGSLLLQHLDFEEQNFNHKKQYIINQEFLQWTYNQYGEQIFCWYITEFYCRVYNFHTKNRIKTGNFYWIIEQKNAQLTSRSKLIKQLRQKKKQEENPEKNNKYHHYEDKKLKFKIHLLNTTNLNVHYFQKLFSFQQQYQQIIMNRVNVMSDQKYINITQSPYANRLKLFKNHVRKMFNEKQQQILEKIVEQKQYKTSNNSDVIAKLLNKNIPQEIKMKDLLHNQTLFEKIILNKKQNKFIKNDKNINKSKTNLKMQPFSSINKYKTQPRQEQTTHRISVNQNLFPSKIRKKTKLRNIRQYTYMVD